MIIRYGITGIGLLLLLLFSVKESMGQTASGPLKCICIDAGHGGSYGKGGDPGALGAISQEKNITLGIVLKLGKLITENYPDIQVVYTRTKDVPVELNRRGKTANDHKADLFISVHINSCTTPSVKGLETYVLGSCRTKESLEVAMKENSVIRHEKDYEKNYGGFDPMSAESYIIFNMLQNLHREKSLILAGAVQEEMVKETKRIDRGVRQNGYLVLKDATMPAILVEAGFISNREEERFLNTSAGQAKIAKAIFRGVSRYKQEVEKEYKRSLAKKTTVVSPPPARKATPKVASSTYTAASTTPLYAIQIASASRKISNAHRLCEGEEVCEMVSEGRYRYYVAQSRDLNETKNKLQSIKSKVKDCFIIAVYQGKIISVAEATKMKQSK